MRNVTDLIHLIHPGSCAARGAGGHLPKKSRPETLPLNGRGRRGQVPPAVASKADCLGAAGYKCWANIGSLSPVPGVGYGASRDPCVHSAPCGAAALAVSRRRRPVPDHLRFEGAHIGDIRRPAEEPALGTDQGRDREVGEVVVRVAAPREPSPYEFALIDYDSGEVVWGWKRPWKTVLVLQEREKPKYLSTVTLMPPKIHVRDPAVPGHTRTAPVSELRPGGGLYHNVDFARRSRR